MTNGHSSEKWKGEGGEGLQSETKQARVRASKEQCQRQQDRLAATGIPVNHGTHTHTVSPTPFFL